jgi:hypothetical protein
LADPEETTEITGVPGILEAIEIDSPSRISPCTIKKADCAMMKNVKESNQ